MTTLRANIMLLLSNIIFSPISLVTRMLLQPTHLQHWALYTQPSLSFIHNHHNVPEGPIALFSTQIMDSDSTGTSKPPQPVVISLVHPDNRRNFLRLASSTAEIKKNRSEHGYVCLECHKTSSEDIKVLQCAKVSVNSTSVSI